MEEEEEEEEEECIAFHEQETEKRQSAVYKLRSCTCDKSVGKLHYCSQSTNPGTGLLGSGAIWAWVLMIIVSGAGTGEIKLPPSFS